jgi:Holliday junction DNA helicase RuvA
MFSFIHGKIVSIDQHLITIESGGFGFAVQVPRPEAFQANKEATVSVHMHWNAEQGPSLFGFATELEKKVFLLITSCSGIGPKIGIAALSQLTPADFLTAVQEGNAKALSAVNGIGPKKAEQMAMQLRDKVAKLVESGITDSVEGATVLADWKQVTQVLQSLNYSRTEIDAALSYLRKEYSGAKASFDELIRRGLSFLAKRV